MSTYHLTSEQRMAAVKHYYEAGCNAAEAARRLSTEFNIRVTQGRIIKAIVEKFNRTGSIVNYKRSGRPVTVTTKEKREEVFEYIKQNPQTSTRRLAAELGISRMSVLRLRVKQKQMTDPLTPDESAFETLSSPNTLIQYESLSQPSSAKFQKISRKQFGDQSLEERRQMASTLMAAPSQLTPRKVSASAVKRAAKSEPLKKLQEKRIFVVANHQRCIMSNMASLWKSGKLCDAGIGNGSSTVMVHKVVLSAVCPKLLSAFSADMFSHKFMQVNFPEKVSKEALTAFAEYMYNGLLNLDCDILEQLKLIANKLDMTEFEELCDSHLPKHMHQPASASASFTDVPLVQTTTPEVDIKQVISEDELTQVLLSQESEVASLALNKSANATSSLISPSIKTEPVEPEDDKYGHCSSSNQAFTPTTSSSTITEATTASTSVPESSTEFAIPLSKTTDVKSTKLKATHSKEEAPLVSDLSCAAGSVETVHSQSSSMNEDSSKPSKSSVDGPSTSTSDKEVSPIGLFVPGGDNLCLLASQTVDGKTIELYNTDLT